MFVLNYSAVFSRTASEIAAAVGARVSKLGAQLAEAKERRARHMELWLEERNNLAREVFDAGTDLPEPLTIAALEAGADSEELYCSEIPSLDAIGRQVADAHELCENLAEDRIFWRAVEDECVRDPGKVCGLNAGQLYILGLLSGN